MRVHPSKKLGYIVIPVIIDTSDVDKINDAFKQLVNVGALGISDELLTKQSKR